MFLNIICLQNDTAKSKMPGRPVPPKLLSTGLSSIPSTHELSIILALKPNL